MKSLLKWLLVVAGLVGVVLVLKQTLFRPRPIEVEVARCARGRVEDAVTNSQAGTVRSRQKARVGAERAGRIRTFDRQEGDELDPGQLILALDATTQTTQLDLARKDLEMSRAQLLSAQAGARLARQEFDRTKQLVSRQLAPQGQLDQATSKLEAADAELAAARARASRAESAVRMQQEELEHLSVRAPFHGVITHRLAEVGESVIPGQPVVEMQNPDSLYTVAPIDEVDIGRLTPGLPARVQLDPYPKLTWQGRLSRVSPIVNDLKEQNRTLDVEVDLAPDSSLPRPKPGTSADVEIILDARDDVLRVPTFAVIEGKRVLLAQNGKAVAREVKTGLHNWDWTEIRDGLKEGDVVITNLDKAGVKAGATVRINSGAAGAEAATPAAATPR